MQVTYRFDPKTEAGRYLVSCARIRKIAVSVMVRRMVDVIADEQLVLSILDDESRPSRNPSEHCFREPRV